MNLSEMREILSREGIQLTKSLGQNFLHDRNQLRRIADMAELTRADRVLEIGPGLGPLTELLLERAGEVLAIEKDARLVALLKQRFPPDPSGARTRHARFQLLHEDALDFLAREQRNWREWKLVANLPYSVASPILVELAQGERAPERLVATVQTEVARRLMARANEDDYGVLSLLVQIDFVPRDSFRIPAGCFFPAPDVESTCVYLQRRAEPLLEGAARGVFVELVKRAFSQRRKLMLKLLKQHWPAERLLQGFEALGISPEARAETVSLEQFVALAKRLS